jgi:hypothetical protein
VCSLLFVSHTTLARAGMQMAKDEPKKKKKKESLPTSVGLLVNKWKKTAADLD